MNEALKVFLQQSKATRMFFLITGYTLTGIAAAGFAANIYNNLTVGQALVALPGQLVELIVAAWGLIFGGSDKANQALEKVEEIFNIDINKDGKVAQQAVEAAVPVVDMTPISAPSTTVAGPLYGPPA